MPISKDIELNIQIHLENFLDNRINTIMKLSVTDIEINPFLIATMRDQLKIKTPHDLAEWMIRQRLERSMVTGFGSTLQNIAKEFCNEKPLPNVTAKIKKNGKTYNLIIKSGSNHNIQVTNNIRRVLLDSKNIEPTSIPVFGICYGNDKGIGSIVKKHTDGILLLTGKRFWDFISGNPDCYKKILDIAIRVDKNYRDPNMGSLGKVIEYKTKNFDAELKKIYGNTYKEFWNGILGDVR